MPGPQLQSPNPGGRERDLLALEERLLDSRRLGATTRVLVLEGAPGIGKSHLIEALAHRAEAEALPVFRLTAPSRERPFGLFESPLSAMCGALAELGVSPVARRTLRAALAPLLGGGPSRPLVPEDRPRAFDAAIEITLLLARERAPLFIVDELHRADPASLELLARWLTALVSPANTHAAADLSAAPRGLVVLGLRTPAEPQAAAGSGPGVGGRVGEALEIALRTLPTERYPLSGLDLEGVRAYLQAGEARSPLAALLASTGGVPARIEAVLSGLHTGAELLSLQQHRLDRLVEQARGDDPGALLLPALELLALENRPISLDVLATALDTPGPELMAQIIEADPALGLTLDGEGAARQVVLEAPELRRLLARRRDAAPPEQRAAGHTRLARALLAHASDPEQIARHLLAAGRPVEALAPAREAAERAASQLDWDRAAAILEQGVAALPRGAFAEAGSLFETLVDLHEARGAFGDALRALGRGRAAGGARAVRWKRAAALCLRLGRPIAARSLCLRLLEADVLVEGSERAQGRTGEERLSIQGILAEACFLEGALARAGRVAVRALEELPAAAGTPDALRARLSLRNTLGKVRLQQAAYEAADEAFAANERSAASAELPGEQAKALNNLGVTAVRAGDLQAARDHYEASLALKLGPADRSREAFALMNLAALHHARGAYEEALDHYHRALSTFTRLGATGQIARTAANLANLYAFLADQERACALAAHAREMATLAGDRYLLAYATLVGADASRAAGDGRGARLAYQQAAAGFDAIDSPRYAAEARLSLAGAYLGTGDLAASRRVLAEVEHLLHDRRLPGLLASWALRTAEVAMAVDGGLDDAVRALARAKDALLEHPDPDASVDLYALDGRLKVLLGDPEGGARSHARARDLLDALASQVPITHRALFLGQPRWRRLHDALLSREITPDHLREALKCTGHTRSKSPRKRTAGVSSAPSAILGRDPRLLKIIALAERLATVGTPVLIRGESGTGKELVADLMHRHSSRQGGPFVKTNCAAMHEALLLSELFGHEKGAFTGAVRQRKGRFEQADGGTLFLDEIGDISPKAQVALLRVLQSGELQRVGGTETLKVDVRLLCATHRDLEAMIASGEFREDLYYRLKGAMLEVPPLRARPDDIPALVAHFLQSLAEKRGEASLILAPEVMTALITHPWPGNVRELENVIASLSLFAEGDRIGLPALEHHPELLAALGGAPGIEAGVGLGAAIGPVRSRGGGGEPGAPIDLFAEVQARGISLKTLKAEIERTCIERALGEASGNISEAARLLGMKRSRLSQIVNADEGLKELCGAL